MKKKSATCKKQFQTGLWEGPEARIHLFFAPGDIGAIPLTDEQAAKLTGLSLAEYQHERQYIENRNGQVTIADISCWVESRINNPSAIKRSKREQNRVDDCVRGLIIDESLRKGA